MFIRFMVVVLCLVVGLGAFAQEDQPQAGKKTPKPLGIGDPAPKLQVSSWVKGEPVKKFEPGQVYVLDFWATWCGPCIAAIPHMTETQAKYKDKGVNLVGISIWESRPSGVTPFVEKKGAGMGYRVAMDAVPAFPEHIQEGSGDAGNWANTKGKMSQAWMKAAGRDGIPSVFIVDQQGRIAWIGHPMGGMDGALAKIVDGTYDLEEAKAAYEQEMKSQAVTRQLQSLLRSHQYDKAFDLARANIEKAWSKNHQMLNLIAWTIVDPEGKVENKDLDLAMDAAQRATDLTGGKDGAILDTLARVHFLKGNVTKAIELQKRAVEYSPDQLKAQLEKALEEYQKAAGEKL